MEQLDEASLAEKRKRGAQQQQPEEDANGPSKKLKRDSPANGGSSASSPKSPPQKRERADPSSDANPKPSKQKKQRKHLEISAEVDQQQTSTWTRPSKGEEEYEGRSEMRTQSPKKQPRKKIGVDEDYFDDMPSHCAQDYNNDVEDIMQRWDALVPPDLRQKLEVIVKELAGQKPFASDKEFERAYTRLMSRSKMQAKKSQILQVYEEMERSGAIAKDLPLKKFLIKKKGKSHSGVLVITVLTSPYPKVGDTVQTFSCKWNCYYCPNEPAHKGNNFTPQPRSYLHDEPSVLRANRNHFDPVLQFYDRAATLAMNGHPVDKVELLVLGGTWASYPHEYQEEFVRDLFYAANTFSGREKREKLSLQEEKRLNESAVCKIIGITLETRPDTIDLEEIKRLRYYGCTRVQLGIQHTDNRILKKINRECTNEEAIRAILLLKNNCFKIDIHLMPNLPFSSPEKDLEMFNYVLDSEDLQVDQWKIYPCEITPWTVIKKWFEEGKYVPYPESDLITLLKQVKKRVHPWIRLNRVIRDIPSQYILGGVDAPNLRQQLIEELKREGTPCRCIRCREVRLGNVPDVQFFTRTYQTRGGTEYFLSFESPDQNTLMGFLRLRLCQNNDYDTLPELRNAALIRELHVYGKLIPTKDQQSSHAQHAGFGRRLMAEAEALAKQHGYKKIAVISGVGVRNYYRKLGYEVEGEGEFQIKHFERPLAASPKQDELIHFVFRLLSFVLFLLVLTVLYGYQSFDVLD